MKKSLFRLEMERRRELGLSCNSESIKTLPSNKNSGVSGGDTKNSGKAKYTNAVPGSKDLQGLIFSDDGTLCEKSPSNPDSNSDGYTITQLTSLCRSKLASQHILAFRILSRIIDMNDLSPEVYGELMDANVPVIIRLGLDHKNDQSIHAALSTLHALLCRRIIITPSIEETYYRGLEFMPFFSCRNDVVSILRESDEEYENEMERWENEDDMSTARRDVILGFVRMGTVQRLSVILLHTKDVAIRKICLSLLVVIARHSHMCASAISLQKEMIVELCKYLTGYSGISVANTENENEVLHVVSLLYRLLLEISKYSWVTARKIAKEYGTFACSIRWLVTPEISTFMQSQSRCQFHTKVLSSDYEAALFNILQYWRLLAELDINRRDLITDQYPLLRLLLQYESTNVQSSVIGIYESVISRCCSRIIDLNIAVNEKKLELDALLLLSSFVKEVLETDMFQERVSTHVLGITASFMEAVSNISSTGLEVDKLKVVCDDHLQKLNSLHLLCTNYDELKTGENKENLISTIRILLSCHQLGLECGITVTTIAKVATALCSNFLNSVYSSSKHITLLDRVNRRKDAMGCVYGVLTAMGIRDHSPIFVSSALAVLPFLLPLDENIAVFLAECAIFQNDDTVWSDEVRTKLWNISFPAGSRKPNASMNKCCIRSSRSVLLLSGRTNKFPLPKLWFFEDVLSILPEISDGSVASVVSNLCVHYKYLRSVFSQTRLFMTVMELFVRDERVYLNCSVEAHAEKLLKLLISGIVDLQNEIGSLPNEEFESVFESTVDAYSASSMAASSFSELICIFLHGGFKTPFFRKTLFKLGVLLNMLPLDKFNRDELVFRGNLDEKLVRLEMDSLTSQKISPVRNAALFDIIVADVHYALLESADVSKIDFVRRILVQDIVNRSSPNILFLVLQGGSNKDGNRDMSYVWRILRKVADGSTGNFASLVEEKVKMCELWGNNVSQEMELLFE